MVEAGYTYTQYKKELINAIVNNDTGKMSSLYDLDVTWYRDVLENMKQSSSNETP